MNAMDDHAFDVEWRFVIPPWNTRRVVITQRQDGPFAADNIGEKGHYYVSMEQLVELSRWEHIQWSTHMLAYDRWEKAHQAAERTWLAEYGKAGRR